MAKPINMGIFTNRELDDFRHLKALYITKEPAWSETMVQVEDLKAWLSTKGLAPSFFFPKGIVEGFRDPGHPRYSAKLACAVSAWEAIKSPSPTKSVKKTIETWVKSNAARFHMVGVSDSPSTKAVSEVSAVVNWDTSGGAVPTYRGDSQRDNEVAVSIENFWSIAPDEDQEPQL